MTVPGLPKTGPADRRQNGPRARLANRQSAGQQQRIPGGFLLLLALYVIFTGTFPTIIQALAFGVEGGAGSEFATAMITGFAFDLLLLLPLLVLVNHPLGILHPLVLAVLLWPIVTHFPNVTQDWGGWAGTLSGMPVDTPSFQALPSHSASTVWMGIAKVNIIRIASVICTYAGFWILRGKPNLSPIRSIMPNPALVRMIMMSLIGLSLVVLFVFLRSRGGLDQHLTSLGAGRFSELSTDGPALIVISLAPTALFIWAAAIPDDIKKPLFIVAMAAAAASVFISNGSRGGALEVPLMVGLIWALRRRTIPWKIALALLPFMFLAIGFLGAIRTSSWAGSTAAQTFDETSWSQSFERTQIEVAARNAANANVPVVERGFEVSGGPLLGSSYAAAVTSFIPRPLWPTKPRGVGQLYARLFLGASLAGTSIPMFPEVEMYWNFGIPGVILLSLLYGILLRTAYHFYWRRDPTPFVTVFYLYFVTSFQFSSDRLVGLEQRVVLVLVCYFLVAIFSPRRMSADINAQLTAGRPGRALRTQP